MAEIDKATEIRMRRQPPPLSIHHLVENLDLNGIISLIFDHYAKQATLLNILNTTNKKGLTSVTAALEKFQLLTIESLESKNESTTTTEERLARAGIICGVLIFFSDFFRSNMEKDNRKKKFICLQFMSRLDKAAHSRTARDNPHHLTKHANKESAEKLDLLLTLKKMDSENFSLLLYAEAEKRAKKGYTPDIAKNVFSIDLSNIDKVANWYIYSVFISSKIKRTLFDRKPYQIVKEYLVKNKASKPTLYETWCRTLQNLRPKIKGFKLLNAPDLTKFIGLTLSPAEEKRPNTPMSSKSLPQTPEISRIEEKPPLTEVTHAYLQEKLDAMKAGKSPKDKCSIFRTLSVIMQELSCHADIIKAAHLDFSFLPSTSNPTVYRLSCTQLQLTHSWNLAINLLISSLKHYIKAKHLSLFKRKVRTLVITASRLLIVTCEQLPQINQLHNALRLIFEPKFPGLAIELVGSLATHFAELTLNLRHSISIETDIDLIISINAGSEITPQAVIRRIKQAILINTTDYTILNEYLPASSRNGLLLSYKMLYFGTKVDLVFYAKHENYPKPIDSYKSFRVNLAKPTVTSTLQNLTQLITRERSFTSNAFSSAITLAYVFRELARNRDEITFTQSFQEKFNAFLLEEANQNIIKQAAALFLTKYTTNIDTPCYHYFKTSALFTHFIMFAQIKKETFAQTELLVKKVIAQNTQQEFSGNIFPVILLTSAFIHFYKYNFINIIKKDPLSQIRKMHFPESIAQKTSVCLTALSLLSRKVPVEDHLAKTFQTCLSQEAKEPEMFSSP